ncbi:hypothetical protein METBIDRAFT_81581 [Metschnikowia bicuspidata var. bicuspidata NRRL YB-4993]|uniref:Carbohydrate kinase FGGY C-terminal domain-containing protein n=1 Tax=Metschnikowia bicuspidata var. bicuspidata NRRL YB-4993 TaxID=869754 RepID=A0A1A0HJE3_9ASCO|nr:hypothetical protein METBIDRAFT_81581 [Metschnikowia bicuspidata var. bicuspidata NRRL YB-4993]OBA24279.1 hypothetical protein METBIDRAFT_81581 [Metschnikowia bicuspidata var. bicuspidata NRRL YB-4993]
MGRAGSDLLAGPARDVQAGDSAAAPSGPGPRPPQILQPATRTPGRPCVRPSAVCVAATCSMVVMERVRPENGRAYFRLAQPGEEVIVWMDTRAQAQAPWVARRLPAAALEQIGGTVTPEMGIAKLKWVSDHLALAGGLDRRDGLVQDTPQNEICVFELYDWVSYVFMAGGYRRDGLVPCLAGDAPDFAAGLRAMDGSVKGWGSDILLRLQIAARVCCTPNTLDPPAAFPHVGSPLGCFGNLLVAHGCIDCYAGWAGHAASGRAARGAGPGALLMVAGTSTCFVASGDGSRARPAAGLWGPFSQLLAAPVYSFGQPATGLLFAELFAEHAALIGARPPFAFVEERARALELSRGHSLVVLARHFLYYGDRHGNRSPYGDFRMGEVLVDGRNAAGADSLGCLVADKSVDVLVLKYYLVVEFLVFQTRQLYCRLARAAGPVADVYISGSQAQNSRLVRMLAHVAFAGSRVLVPRGVENKYAGSRGAALAMLPYLQAACAPAPALGGAWAEPGWQGPGPMGAREARILQAKFRTYEQMARWQKLFHDTMGAI